jgi:hypothetical protein
MTNNRLTELPQSLVNAVRNNRDIAVEGDAILFSVDQGYSPYATITINHWLAVRDGALVMEVHLSQRSNAKVEDWAGGDEFVVSEPMTEAQALQVVDYWCRMASNAKRLALEQDRQERERFDAFGPCKLRPWEE